KVGLGSRIGAVRTLFTQGAIESTGRSLDLSVQGQGFFVLRDGLGQVYTRAGNFQLDANGVVQSLRGDQLQGIPLNPDGTAAGGGRSRGARVSISSRGTAMARAG